MAMQGSIAPALTAKSELLSAQEAVEIARLHFGIAAEAHRLPGEKDSNFSLSVSDGRELLLKVVNPGEDPAVTNMHTLALAYVASRDPGMPVQRIVPDLEGRLEFQLEYGPDDVRTVRMVTFTQGALQRKTTQSPQQRRNAGAMLARLQDGLLGFKHPAEAHFSTWDMKNALHLKPMLAELTNADDRAELIGWLDRFGEEVLPHLPSMRSQVVHNDLNSDNIIVDPDDTDRIVGIIDFGDMVKTPVLFDVAVGAAYQLTDADDPMAAACDFIAGFNERRPLLANEIEHLHTSIIARTVMRIAITEWRAVRFPENRTYILRNTPKSWQQFHRLVDIPHAAANDLFARALSSKE
jgi:Ser/Thr protein kinase RdoA (MazF antagonist)